MFLILSFKSHAELWSDFDAGVGTGHETLAGDYVRDQKGSVIELGFNVHQENLLFRLLGRTEDDYRFKGSDFIVGYGNRYFKVGTGLMGIQGTIPSSDKIMTSVDGFGLIQEDRNRDTDVSVTTVPYCYRLHPTIRIILWSIWKVTMVCIHAAVEPFRYLLWACKPTFIQSLFGKGVQRGTMHR